MNIKEVLDALNDWLKEGKINENTEVFVENQFDTDVRELWALKVVNGDVVIEGE